MNGKNNSLDINTPTSKLLEKSGKGNNKNPATKPITIAIFLPVGFWKIKGSKK